MLVATIVCTFLVLVVSSTTAYAAVGDTFIKEGLTYKVVSDSNEVEIIDCDESASSVNVRTSIMYGEEAFRFPIVLSVFQKMRSAAMRAR